MATQSKTAPTEQSVGAFLGRVEDPRQREDSASLVALMERVSGKPAVMWGPSIVGFGSYHYRYASGREGDACLTGFSPRKGEFAIYLAAADEGDDGQERLLARLGKHRMGKGCLYIKRLADIDEGTLEALVRDTIERLRRAYPE